jgi:hypothetical protein
VNIEEEEVISIFVLVSTTRASGRVDYAFVVKVCLDVSISKERSEPKIFTFRGMKDGQMKFENFLFDSMLKLQLFF